ncbi:hypothetical protein [Pseudoalteromonas gelatinilytica]
MAKLTICSDGFNNADQVTTIEINEFNEISVLVDLVKYGSKEAGLIKPAVIIESNGNEQTVSQRNDWKIDKNKL